MDRVLSAISAAAPNARVVVLATRRFTAQVVVDLHRPVHDRPERAEFRAASLLDQVIQLRRARARRRVRRRPRAVHRHQICGAAAAGGRTSVNIFDISESYHPTAEATCPAATNRCSPLTRSKWPPQTPYRRAPVIREA
jgi:hypothetical protein